MDYHPTALVHLEDLKLRYIRSLPDRVARTRALWEKLQQDWNQDNLLDLYRQVRWMAGCAATLKVQEILDGAHPWFLYIRQLDVNAPPDEAGTAYCRQTLQYLTDVAAYMAGLDESELVTTLKSDLPDLPPPSRQLVYLVQEHSQAGERLGRDLVVKGIQTRCFDSFLDFYEGFQQLNPDLIIMDTYIDNRCTLDHLKTFRKISNAGIPVILTLDDQYPLPNFNDASRVGVISILSKPLVETRLMEQIKRAEQVRRTEKKSILVIDEDEVAAAFLETMLKSAGFETRHVTDARYVLRPMEDNFRPELVVLNLDQLYEDPVELVETIHKEKLLRGIPFLFLSYEATRDRATLADIPAQKVFLEPGIENGILISTAASLVENFRANGNKTPTQKESNPVIAYDDEEGDLARFYTAGTSPSGPLPEAMLVRVAPDVLEPGMAILTDEGQAYTLATRLRQNESSPVFTAQRLKDDRNVRLQFYFFADPRDRKRQRLLEQARALLATSHPNIVPVLGVHESQTGFYMATEYLVGEPLQRILDGNGALKPGEAVRAVQAVTSALATLQGKDLVHQAICPANIIRTPEGRYVLANFDLLPDWHTDPGPAQEFSDEPGPHLAPEQLRVKRIDHRTDVFGLGATFYQLVTGKPPFPRTISPTDLTERLKTTPDPRTHIPAINAQLAKVIMRMMALEPKYRYQNFTELDWDLSHMAGLVG